jgi:hypothetical protein
MEERISWSGGFGGAFEEDVEGLADDSGGAPEDHSGDDEGEEGIDPGEAGEEDGRAASDDGGGGEGVAEHVEEDAADVDVAGELPEQAGDAAVHEDAGGGDDHHQPGLDGTGAAEAVESGDGDPTGEDDEREGVDEGGEDTGALVAEGLLFGGGAALEVDGNEGEHDGEHVRDVVAGLGDEGEGVGADSEVEGRDDVAESGGKRELQHLLHLVRGCGDHVHVWGKDTTGGYRGMGGKLEGALSLPVVRSPLCVWRWGCGGKGSGGWGGVSKWGAFERFARSG